MGGVALLGAGRRRGYGFVVVAQSRHMIGSVGGTTVGAGVGGVATFGTGRSGDAGHIVVAQFCHFPALAVVATGTYLLLLALLRAGRCLNLNPIAHIMAQGSGIVVYITVATTADVDGVTALGASRLSYHCLEAVGMAQCGNGTGFVISTGRTISLFQTFGVLTGFSDGVPFSKAVASCGNYFLLHQDLSADRAMLAFRQTGFGASRSNRRINDLSVAFGYDLTDFSMITAGTGSLLLAILRTGGLLDNNPLTHIMTQGFGVTVNVAVAAVGTGMGSVAAFGASRGSH
jgi:hypothetical protein